MLLASKCIRYSLTPKSVALFDSGDANKLHNEMLGNEKCLIQVKPGTSIAYLLRIPT